MLITFAPNGDTALVPPTKPAKGTVIAPVGIPYIETLDTTPPTTPYDGVIVDGGSSRFPISGGPVFKLKFIRENGVTDTDFDMDSEAAIDTALATIATALNASTEAITLNSDGTLGS